MSWYRNPELFIFGSHSLFEPFVVYRITKQLDSSIIVLKDLMDKECLSFSKHLSLVNNKESGFNAFKATFPTSGDLRKFINCYGLVINWDVNTQKGTWSTEEPNSPFWSLPGIKSVTEQPLEAKVFHLEAKISSLQDEVNSNKVEKESIDKKILNLEKQVSDLTSKLVPCCGASTSVKEPWITGHTVPSNWVSFEELDVLTFSEDTPLTITKAKGGLKLGVDYTTNIQANRFYRGMYPIVLVDIAELTPNREEARFDPYVWGSYTNAGMCYAARKPFASGM